MEPLCLIHKCASSLHHPDSPFCTAHYVQFREYLNADYRDGLEVLYKNRPIWLKALSFEDWVMDRFVDRFSRDDLQDFTVLDPVAVFASRINETARQRNVEL